MQERYQRDYPGEYVITKTVVRNGVKHQDREWVDNPLLNQHISGRAVVIGVGDTLLEYKDRIQLLQNHKGGLLGSHSLQSYGSYKHDKVTPQFIVSSNKEFLTNSIESGLVEETNIITNARRVLQYPGQFYLIPYNPVLIDSVAAVYMACFHEHREIYLLGYDQDNLDVVQGEMRQLDTLIKTYKSTQFYFVSNGSTVPTQLLKNTNVEKLTYWDFVIHADI